MSKKLHADRERGFQRFLLRQSAAEAVPGVPVFYLGQSDAGTPCLVVTRLEARDMKLRRLGTFINRGRAFRLSNPAPEPPPEFTCSDSGDTSCTISEDEMRANVGITANKPEEAPLRHVVKRAQQKIRAIGRREAGTFDPKAPLAFGQWVTPTFVEVPNEKP